MKNNSFQEKKHKLAKNILESYEVLLALDDAYILNQANVYGKMEFGDIEYLFKNHNLDERNNEEEKILINNKLSACIMKVLVKMRDENDTPRTRTLIRLITDIYLKREYQTTEKLTKKYNISARTYQRMKNEALNMFGDCLVETYGENLDDYERVIEDIKKEKKKTSNLKLN